MADLAATISNIGFFPIVGTILVIGLLVYAFIPKKPGSGDGGSSSSSSSSDNNNNDGGQQ